MITQTTSHLRKIWISCCFVLMSVMAGFSQSHITYTIDGFTSTSNTLSFDVYITNDGTTQLKLAGYTVGINHNPAILNNSTLFTTTSANNATPFTFNAGSRDSRLSTLNALSQITYQHTANGAKNHMRFGNTPVSFASGNAVLLETGTLYKIGRFTFANSNGVNWSSSSNASLAYQLLVVSGYANSVAACFVDSNTSTTTLTGTTTASIQVAGAYLNTPYLLNTCTNTTGTTTVSACDTYTWSAGNGQTYTSTPTTAPTSVTSIAGGCTNTQTLNLTITPSSENVTTASACDTYTWSNNEQAYTESGTYTGTTANCVTQKLNLTITPSSDNVTTASACDTYTWSNNSQTYTSSGTYTGTTANCVTQKLNLTITPSSNNTTTASACDTYTWSNNSQIYTSSGSYTGTTANCVTQLLNLTINQSTTSSETQTACGSYLWPVNGQTYSASGTYTSTSTNAAGCPDTKILILTITPNTNNTTTVTQCDTYTWSVNNQTYTASGNFSVTTGCNTEYLELTINNSTSSTTAASSCGSYTWAAPLGNGQTYTTSQTGVIHTSTNAAGCTHTQTLNLTILNESITAQPLAPFICNATGSTTSVSVSTNAVSPSYQWQSRVVTTANPNSTWNNMVANANYSGVTTSTLGITRTATVFTAGTQFRVLVTAECGVLTSNAVALTVITTIKAGTITSPASVCLGGNINFTLGGYAGTSVQWQSALSNSAAAPGVFTDIPGATSNVLTVTGATAGMDKSYRAVVSSTCVTPTATATTAVKTIKVDPTTVAGTITGGGVVCSGGSGTIRLVGYVGKLQWEYSTNGVTYVNAPAAAAGQTTPFSTTSVNSIGVSYVVTNITQDLYFRARVVSGTCLVLYAAPVQFTIGTSASVGTASAAATSAICTGTSTTLSLTGPNVGVITWQKKTLIATTWSNVLNSNVTSISTGNLTASTMFRASVTIGLCSVVTSNEVTVAIVAAPVSKTLTSNVTTPSGGTQTLALCSDFRTTKTLTVGSGSNGTIKWQRSTTSSTLGFADISGATGLSYTINQASVGQNWYRAVFTNSCGASVNGAAVTLWYKECLTKMADSAIASEFNAVAYPNPYSENFNLSLTTSSEDKVGIVVYDMTGRLIERREVSPSDVVEQRIGDRYPSGVYNVVVTQGEEVKTLRVIKR